MSEGNASIDTMRKYIIYYSAEYEVEAENEDDALDIALEKHAQLPDGYWEVEEIA